MEQPTAVQMAATGGRIGKQEGGIMETEVSEVPGYTAPAGY